MAAKRPLRVGARRRLPPLPPVVAPLSRGFSCAAATVWNKLPESVINCKNTLFHKIVACRTSTPASESSYGHMAYCIIIVVIIYA